MIIKFDKTNMATRMSQLVRYFNEGKLGIHVDFDSWLNDHPGLSSCAYSYEGTPNRCAIGAMLTKDELQLIFDHELLEGMINELTDSIDPICQTTENIYRDLKALQSKHDAAASAIAEDSTLAEQYVDALVNEIIRVNKKYNGVELHLSKQNQLVS